MQPLSVQPGDLRLSPEMELLRRLARPAVAGCDGGPGELLHPSLDWNAVLALAQHHQLRPLLYWRLAALPAPSAPPAVMATLRHFFEQNAQRNLHYTAELLRVIELLASAGIQAVPYKGPVLASAAYGNLALREFVDLDLLVRRSDASSARLLLLADAYGSPHRYAPRQEAAHIRTQYTFDFVHRRLGIPLEVHWDIAPRYLARLSDALFDRPLSSQPLAGRSVSCLPPEMQILALSLHGSKHVWHRLIWLADVAHLIPRCPTEAWPSLIEWADRLGLRNTLLTGLALAHTLLEVPLPPLAAERIDARPQLPLLVRRVVRQFQPGGRPPVLWDACLYHWRTQDSLFNRLRYAWRFAASPTHGDWELLRLPRPLFFLHYALRPLRLAASYGTRLVRRRDAHGPP
jgi:hypothetical protein